ncbi:MAG: hydrolase [Hyphococcus sp.]|nr:MAG: hydrolase [Marinicaulis sp.]
MSLKTQYDNGNIFAKIIRGDIPSTKIFEDDNILAFMDAFPQSLGHCLVIHKTATATNILDIETADLNKVTSAVQKLARAVNAALQPDGIRVAQFNGAPAGQTVFHLHFHIIPIYENMDTSQHGESKASDPEMLQATAERIHQAL